MVLERTHVDLDGADSGHEHLDDHDHEHDDEHEHDHGHGASSGPRPVSSRGLLALAVAGGILPSPTAFVVLTGAISAHRIGYGLALIAAFSMGLAAALIVVGMVALRARAVMTRRLGGRLQAIVPVVSALVIVGFGCFFALRGLSKIG